MLSELPLLYGGTYDLSDPSYQVGLIIMTWISILVLAGPALISAFAIFRGTRKEGKIHRFKENPIDMPKKTSERPQKKAA